jgi:hypothetical protein
MAWETRRGRRYYYRARKVGGQVVMEYVGSGALAELVAEQDQAERLTRQASRARAAAVQTEARGGEAHVRSLDALASLLARATLAAEGFRRHRRGAWRRPRRARGRSPS